METNIDSLQFYVRAVTGLLLFLNLALLVAIQYGRGWVYQLTLRLPSHEQMEVTRKSDRALGLLIAVVITMNGASVFANYQLRKSADALVGETSNSHVVVSLNTGNH